MSEIKAKDQSLLCKRALDSLELLWDRSDQRPFFYFFLTFSFKLLLQVISGPKGNGQLGGQKVNKNWEHFSQTCSVFKG